MKKLLVFVAAFAVGSHVFAEPVANVAPAAPVAPVAQVVPVAQVGTVAKVKSMVGQVSEKTTKAFNAQIAALDAQIVKHPKTAILVAMVTALIAEQVASFVYNNCVASDDFDEEDEDLDIA